MPRPYFSEAYYLERAEETRTIADLMNTYDCKAKMLKVSHDYEDLAEYARLREEWDAIKQ